MKGFWFLYFFESMFTKCFFKGCGIGEKKEREVKNSLLEIEMQ